MLAQAGVPIVEIMDIDGTPVDSAVGISHRRAGRQMAEAIIAAGYRRIAFLGTQMPSRTPAPANGWRGSKRRCRRPACTLVDREYYTGGSSLLKGREMTEATPETHAGSGFSVLFQ